MDTGGEMMRLCRLCLVKDQVNIPIFEEQGEIRQIFLKISSCLPVKVSRDDKLPKKICDGCSYKLDMLYEFWNTSANAEKTLLSWLGQAGVKANDADETISAVAQQINKGDAPFVKEEALDPNDAAAHQTQDVDPNFMLQNFQQKWNDEGSSAGPSATVTSNDEPPRKRARRTAAVKAQINLTPESEDEDDLDNVEPMTKVEDESDDSDGDDREPAFVDVPGTSADDQPGPSGVGKDGVEAPNRGVIKNIQNYRSEFCGICRRKFKNPEEKTFNLNKIRYFQKCRVCRQYFIHNNECDCMEYKHNLENVSGMNTVNTLCGFCEQLLSNKTNKRNHKCFHQLQNAIKSILTCNFCRRNFDSLEALSQHKNQAASYPYRCTKCHGYFSFQSPCICPDNNYRLCRFCSKPLNNLLNIASHACFHQYAPQEQIIECEFCQKKMTHKLLDKHLKRHFKVKPQKKKREYPPKKRIKYKEHTYCRGCDINFGSEAEYRQHRKHEHRATPVCQICGKTVKEMYAHVRIHTGEEPYRCSVCGKTFKYRKSFARHRLVHANEFTHLCCVCGKSYKTKFSLRVHKRSHEDVKPFECGICAKTFATKRSRDDHMKTHNK